MPNCVIGGRVLVLIAVFDACGSNFDVFSVDLVLIEVIVWVIFVDDWPRSDGVIGFEGSGGRGPAAVVLATVHGAGLNVRRVGGLDMAFCGGFFVRWEALCDSIVCSKRWTKPGS